jgi:hypothetical protein
MAIDSSLCAETIRRRVANITGAHANNKACVRRDNGQERSWPDMCMPLQTLNGGVENLRQILTATAHWWRGNQKKANIITAARPALGQWWRCGPSGQATGGATIVV